LEWTENDSRNVYEGEFDENELFTGKGTSVTTQAYLRKRLEPMWVIFSMAKSKVRGSMNIQWA
jgi:hypothetical protein